MGIITGLTFGVAAFTALKKYSHPKSLPYVNSDQLNIVQNIPGRLRVYSGLLKQHEFSKNITIQLIRIDGISSVGTNEMTGSLLITYDADKIKSDLMIAALIRLLGLDPTDQQLPSSTIQNELQLVNQSINYALLNKTNGLIDLKTIIPLSFLALAVKEYLRTGTLGTPTPITLLYWTYNGLGLGGNRREF